MKKKYYILLFRFFLLGSVLALILGMNSCKKSGTDCLTSTGKIIREVRDVSEFDSIDMEGYVNLVLIQDSVCKVEVEAGENLMNGIDTKVTNRQLVIRNNLVCNWIRSYAKPINVYASVKKLKKIYYYSSGNISTLTPIRSDNLLVDIWGGAGSIDMNLDITGFGSFILHMGTADLTLHGACAICSIYSGDYGFIQAKDLQTDYSYVINAGSNDVYVRSRKYLQADIESIGNIYYTGNPDSLSVRIHGPGEVIPF